MSLATIYQIYFDDSQLPMLEKEYIPYKNENCTVFFENAVMAELVDKKIVEAGEYFGVVSYKLRGKIGLLKKWKSLPNIANHSVSEFTPELFESELQKHKPDVMSFQRHIGHDTVSFADKFHPNFSKYFSEITQRIGYNWQPTYFKNVFYCNYFVAKSFWYEKFIDEMLVPAMNVMKNMPELHGNSGYPHKLPEHLQKKFGYEHYPYHPFLCERMFSYFAHIHNLNCLHF